MVGAALGRLPLSPQVDCRPVDSFLVVVAGWRQAKRFERSGYDLATLKYKGLAQLS